MAHCAVGGEHFLKIIAPKLFRFEIDSILKIFSQRVSQLINQSMNYKGVCGTAPATPGLLNIFRAQTSPNG